MLNKSRGVWLDVVLGVSLPGFVGMKRILSRRLPCQPRKVSVLAAAMWFCIAKCPPGLSPAGRMLEDAAAARFMISFRRKALP